MKVTPIGKKFGKYAPGDVFEFPDTPAKAFIKMKKLAPAHADEGHVTAHRPVYQTRAMVAADPIDPVEYAERDANGIEWNAELHTSTKLKNSDGTWRKKPGRAAA